MLGLLSFLPGLAGKLLDFLRSPVGVAVMIGLAYFVGHWRGDQSGSARELARIEVEKRAAIAVGDRARAACRADPAKCKENDDEFRRKDD